MKAQTEESLTPIPGLEVVGRGVYLRPRQPYELKEVFFKRDKNWVYYSRETGQSFAVPEGYEVNDSPPMPSDEALNQTFIEESWERLDDQVSLSANVAASNSVFSIDVNVGQTRQFRSEENAYYALRSSCIPLWNVYLPNTAGFSDKIFTLDVPTPFRHACRKDYEKFFERYGSHYVKRAWVGGKATLAFIIAKSSDLKKEDIQAGIKASLGGLGVSGGASRSMQESQEKLQNNSECRVFGKGGDESKLAMLSKLDEVSYNEWLASVKNNPQVIELELAGIWTLISDPEKAKALQEAYSEATTFDPVNAIFGIDRRIFFVRGNKFFRLYLDTGEVDKPQEIFKSLPVLSQPEFADFARPDAAFTGFNLLSPTGEKLDRKIFLFKRGECICIDFDTGEIDEGYPTPIVKAWPGVPFDRVDAALNAGPDSVYFFRGNQYVRYNAYKQRVDDEYPYPEPISKRWIGVIFDRIDASIYWQNGKVYFFKDDQYIRYDMANYRADAGYPKFVTSNYVEDWRFFD